MRIFEYADYRKYLKDYYTEQKSRSPSYSYRVFANRAKLVSPNYLKLVIDGKRRITDKCLDPFIRGLGLGKQEARYFRSLVQYQECVDADAKGGYLEELIKIRRKGTQRACEISDDRLEILRKWHHWAIREMVLLEDFSSDPTWISRRLSGRITPKEAQESLKLLERLEFIEKEGSKYIQKEPLISTSDEIASLMIRDLHKQFIELGMNSIFNSRVERREVNGLTLAISKSRLPKLKQAIKNFRKELNRSFGDPTDPCDDVYHLTILLSPLTQERENP